MCDKDAHQLSVERVELVDSRHVEAERVGERDEGLDSFGHMQRRRLALVPCEGELLNLCRRTVFLR